MRALANQLIQAIFSLFELREGWLERNVHRDHHSAAAAGGQKGARSFVENMLWSHRKVYSAVFSLGHGAWLSNSA